GIPRDVVNDELARPAVTTPESYRITHPSMPHPDAISAAVRLLRQAERPLLLVGGGASWADANDLVVRLSERCSMPMITAYGRNDAVPNDHPLYVGPLGRAGPPAAAAPRRPAGPLLRLGSRLAPFTTPRDHPYSHA